MEVSWNIYIYSWNIHIYILNNFVFLIIPTCHLCIWKTSIACSPTPVFKGTKLQVSTAHNFQDFNVILLNSVSFFFFLPQGKIWYKNQLFSICSHIWFIWEVLAYFFFFFKSGLERGRKPTGISFFLYMDIKIFCVTLSKHCCWVLIWLILPY